MRVRSARGYDAKPGDTVVHVHRAHVGAQVPMTVECEPFAGWIQCCWFEGTDLYRAKWPVGDVVPLYPRPVTSGLESSVVSAHALSESHDD